MGAKKPKCLRGENCENLPASIRDNSGKVLYNEGQGSRFQPAVSQNHDNRRLKRYFKMSLFRVIITVMMMKYYLVAECWSARIIVSKQEVRLSVFDKEVSQRIFKSAKSYLYRTHKSYESFIRIYCREMLLLVCGR